MLSVYLGLCKFSCKFLTKINFRLQAEMCILLLNEPVFLIK